MNLVYNIKKYFILCFFTIPFLLLFSCTKDEYKAESVFSYSDDQSTTLSAKENGDILIFKFNSTANWTAKSDADWITFPSEGEDGTIYFKIQVKENLSDNDRVGVITINSGSDNIVLDISQKIILDKNNIKIIAVGQIVNDINGVKTSISALWENNEYLRAITPANTSSSIQDIKFLNGDYYMAGYIQLDRGIVDYIWKNANTKTQISPSNAYCNISHLYCNNNDLYGVGYIYDASWVSHAIVWKNNEVVLSFTYNSNKVLAYDMTMIDKDYYIGGAYYDNYGSTMPSIFKNNKLQYQLSDKQGQVNAVATDGKSIYSCGYFKREVNGVDIANGNIWRDANVLYDLSKDGVSVNPERILLEGNDIYVAGILSIDNQTKGAIWKNGQLLYTYDSEGGVSRIASIFVYKGDVYAGGFYRNKADGNVAVIWKNDKILYTLSDPNSKLKGSTVSAMIIRAN